MRRHSITGRPMTAGMVLPGALVVALAMTATVDSQAAAASSPVATAASGQGCSSEIVHLPSTAPEESGSATALNDRGWVVGAVFSGSPARAVLWRENQPPIELGVGGTEGPGRAKTTGWPVDVNESGVVAIQRGGQNAEGEQRRRASFLWENGTLTRLNGSRDRPAAVVEAINDNGVAVGSISGRGKPSRPVVWLNGVLRERLPRPPSRYAVAVDVNNAGIAVGRLLPAGAEVGTEVPWWWSTTTGRGGPLDIRLGDRVRTGGATSVDEKGRIVGDLGPVVKWRDRDASPQKLFSNAGASALHASGHVTGSFEGFRGVGSRAFVARLSDGAAAALPIPPGGSPLNSFGSDIARGVTAYAPEGGITVAGQVQFDEQPYRATLWTCAQSHLTFTRTN
jgi:uncharacterized membrane protein